MKLLALTVPGNNGNVTITPPNGVPDAGISTGTTLISIASSILILLAVVLAMAFIIYAGIQWTMSGGDKQKIQAARQRLIFSIIGLIVVVLAGTIVNFVYQLLGVGKLF